MNSSFPEGWDCRCAPHTSSPVTSPLLRRTISCRAPMVPRMASSSRAFMSRDFLNVRLLMRSNALFPWKSREPGLQVMCVPSAQGPLPGDNTAFSPKAHHLQILFIPSPLCSPFPPLFSLPHSPPPDHTSPSTCQPRYQTPLQLSTFSPFFTL